MGLGETVHREVNKQVCLILHELSSSFPQEWAKALDLVFYVMMTTPLQASGFCARDLDRCWSMRDHLERELVRFDVGPMLPLEEWAQKLFERYRMIRGSVTRYLAAESEKRAEAFDKGLHPREWEIGDKVFRKESRGVASKFLPRNSGPYWVVQILSRHKVVLAKSDGEVAFSYPVPIAELIFVPERNRGSPELDLKNPGMTRSLGTMLRTSAPIPGTKSRFAGVGVGAYLAYKQNPRSPKPLRQW